MVDFSNPIGGPTNALTRAASSNALITTVNATQPAQAIINRQSNGARPTTVQQISKTGGTPKDNSPLPRGSIVDVLV